MLIYYKDLRHCPTEHTRCSALHSTESAKVGSRKRKALNVWVGAHKSALGDSTLVREDPHPLVRVLGLPAGPVSSQNLGAPTPLLRGPLETKLSQVVNMVRHNILLLYQYA